VRTKQSVDTLPEKGDTPRGAGASLRGNGDVVTRERWRLGVLDQLVCFYCLVVLAREIVFVLGLT